MRLNEIPVGTVIKIHVYNEKGSFDLETKTIGTIAKPVNSTHYGVYINPIKVNGQPINFDKVQKKLTFTHPKDNRNYEIRTSYIGKSSVDKNKYMILSSENIAPINYRQNVRVELCEPCILKLGSDSPEINAYIKDISFNGIAFVLNTEAGHYNYQIGDEIAAVFMHNSTKYHVHGEIVRATEGEKRLILGCTIHNPDSSLTLLINVLQIKNKHLS